METAIKKAIEGGYRKYDPMVADGSYFNMVGERILLDLEFWQSLAQASGWNFYEYKKSVTPPKSLHQDRYTITVRRKSSKKANWIGHWHRFIDHLAEGKDAHSFFESLLSQDK